MSRKEASFSNLYDYMKKGTEEKDLKYRYSRNLYGNTREEIIEEFEKNSKLLQQRKNGNYLYHEVVSIKKPQNSQTKTYEKEALFDLVNYYVEQRCPNNLVYGYLHDEHKHNLHFHLMISANEINKKTRYRITKQKLKEAKEKAENLALSKYPELKQEKTMTKQSQYAKNKQGLIDSFEFNARISSSYQEFLQAMENDGFIYYKRGKTDGFKIEQTGKKHRLKTLGLSKEFEIITNKYEQHKDQRQPGTKTKEKSRTYSQDEIKKEPQSKEEKQKSFKQENHETPEEKRQENYKEPTMKEEHISKAKAEIKAIREEQHTYKQKTNEKEY